MKERFANLLTVKSIVTLALTIVFCVLALCGTISGQEFLAIFTTVIAFYFGTQVQKRADAEAPKPTTEAVAAAPMAEQSGTVAVVDDAMHEQIDPDEVTVNGFAG